MQNTVLRMLVALMCILAACADVMPVQDFDLQRMGGKWYTVGFATNAAWFVNHKDKMKVGTANFVPTADGDIELNHAHVKDDGTCWRMNHLAKKTDTPGRFTFYSQKWNNDNDVRVVDVNYDSYALLHTIKTRDGVSEVLNQLYTRTTDVSADLQQKFLDFSLQTGVLAENVAMLPSAAECTED
ncbi:lipocalin-like [Corythoichthys intestinalis]|uniref:lipocalin-like n=1 Tax=Corythoichthys intestinalis TaxID=161448 RepID=UPI0025A61882|nr:lipocalin-like [Corythoichthys intestinalis]